MTNWIEGEQPFEADRIEEPDHIRFLHVDDNPRFSRLVETYVGKITDNIVVINEPDAEAGLNHLTESSIDCIVSDYDMPGMNGIEFLKRVREEYPNLPFILFTGRGSEEVASEAINAGVTSYLQKGSERDTYELLVNQIQEAVSHHRSQRLAKITKSRLFDLYEYVHGFYVLDEDWGITYWNQQIAERTGRSPEEVLDRNFWEVFPETTEMQTKERFSQAMETGEPVQFETQFRPADYWAEVRAYPIDGGLFVHSREITIEKERQQELERRNQILKSFANTVSHDLRNPLNVAEGRLQLAQDTGDFEHLDDVAQAHNRMRNLIDELLRLARGEELVLSDVSLEKSATQAWETVSSEGMALSIEDSATFEAHATQLRRVFENLYWNALRHGNANTVWIGVIEDSGIFVEDDGVGIPPGNRDRVFETGFSTVEDSPGYGLHLVESVIEMHGWEISVTEGRSGGARFEISGVELME